MVCVLFDERIEIDSEDNIVPLAEQFQQVLVLAQRPGKLTQGTRLGTNNLKRSGLHLG